MSRHPISLLAVSGAVTAPKRIRRRGIAARLIAKLKELFNGR